MSVPRRPGSLGRRAAYATVLLLPSLVVLVPFFLVPLCIMAAYSVYRYIPGGGTETTFTLENYSHFLTDGFYLRILLDTLVMGAVVSLLSLVLSFPIAFTLARSRSRWRGLLMVIVLVPLMISVVVRTYGWMILLAGGGVVSNTVNDVLGVFGFGPAQLMFNFTGTVIALTEVLMPFMILTLVGVIQHIDPALEDSVRSLGGGRWRVFRDVILPLSRPGIAAGTVLVFILSISAFATPKLVGGATTKVMATLVFDRATTLLNWPFASAISFVLVVLVLALVVVQGRLLAASRRWA